MKNVIILVVDCLRKDYFNNKSTPHIFKISKEGISFENAYANGPWSPPSITSLLTSTYAMQYEDSMSLSKKTISIAEVLKKQGYKTAAFTIGGWLSSFFGYNKGFDYFYEKKEDNKKGKIKGLIHKIFPFLRNIHRFLYLYLNSKELSKSIDENLVKEATEWIKQNKDSPFFVWMHLEDSHEPYLRGKERKGKLRINSKLYLPKDKLTENEISSIKEMYGEALQSSDYWVNELITNLREMNLFNDTYIIICGDHGQELYEHEDFGHGPKFYEECIHVPLIIIGPEIKKKAESRNVSLIDIAPTILEFLKIPKPENFLGENVLDSKKNFCFSLDGRKQLLTSPNIKEVKYDSDYKRIALIKDNYKYIANPSKSDELYDLKKDVYEKNNILTFEKKIASELREQIDHFIKSQENFKIRVEIKESEKENLKDSDKDEEERVKERLKELGYI